MKQMSKQENSNKLKQQNQETTGQSTTKIQTTTGKVKKVINILAITLLLLGVIAYFFHRVLPDKNENPHKIALDSERKELKKYWNNKEAIHDSLFINNLISKQEYFKVKSENESARILAFREITKKRKLITKDFSFNGRSGLHYWLWIFGISLISFTASLFLSLKDARLHRLGLLKWYEPHLSIFYISITLFWLYHTIFMTKIDFEITTYLIFMICIMIGLSYFIYHFLRRTIVIEERLLENIRDLVSHALYNTKKEKEEEKWELLDKVADNGR